MIDILAGTPIASCDMTYQSRVEISTTGGGITHVRNMSSSLWRASYTTPPLSFTEAGRVTALLHRCEEDSDVFRGHDHRRPGPASDPGASLGGVTLSAVAGSNREIRLAGLPAGFEMSIGDYVSFSHPAGRMLHRVSSGGSADGLGVSSLLGVVPNVTPGADTGVDATLKKAFAHFLVVPGSVSTQEVGPRHLAVSWSGIQVIE